VALQGASDRGWGGRGWQWRRAMRHVAAIGSERAPAAGRARRTSHPDGGAAPLPSGCASAPSTRHVRARHAPAVPRPALPQRYARVAGRAGVAAASRDAACRCHRQRAGTCYPLNLAGVARRAQDASAVPARLGTPYSAVPPVPPARGRHRLRAARPRPQATRVCPHAELPRRCGWPLARAPRSALLIELVLPRDGHNCRYGVNCVVMGDHPFVCFSRNSSRVRLSSPTKET
jgi:hypothetical protein